MDFATALASVQAALILGREAIAARDELKIANAKQEFAGVAFDLQNAALDLQQKLIASSEAESTAKRECAELRDQIAKMQRQAAERDRYQLECYSGGTFVLALKAGHENGEPLHYLCQPCMDNAGKKSILQPRGELGNLACPECGQKHHAVPKHIRKMSKSS